MGQRRMKTCNKLSDENEFYDILALGQNEPLAQNSFMLIFEPFNLNTYLGF